LVSITAGVYGSTLAGGDNADSFYFGSTIADGYVSMDAGSDLAVFHDQVSGDASIYGGDGGDTLMFNQSVDAGITVDAGVGDDSVFFSLAQTSTTVLAGAGNDTITFSSTVSAAQVNLGAGQDSIVFNAVVNDTSLVGGGGIQTIQFSSANDLVSLSATFSGVPSWVVQEMTPFVSSSVLRLELMRTPISREMLDRMISSLITPSSLVHLAVAVAMTRSLVL